MFEVTYTWKKDGYFYKRKCAKALQEIVEYDNHVELKVRRYSWDYTEELVKERYKTLSVSDFMRLDLYAKEKVLLTITGRNESEEALMAERICRAWESIK